MGWNFPTFLQCFLLGLGFKWGWTTGKFQVKGLEFICTWASGLSPDSSSWNPKMIWFGMDLKSHPIPTPATGRNHRFHYPRLLQPPSSWPWTLPGMIFTKPGVIPVAFRLALHLSLKIHCCQKTRAGFGETQLRNICKKKILPVISL